MGIGLEGIVAALRRFLESPGPVVGEAQGVEIPRAFGVAGHRLFGPKHSLRRSRVRLGAEHASTAGPKLIYRVRVYLTLADAHHKLLTLLAVALDIALEQPHARELKRAFIGVRPRSALERAPREHVGRGLVPLTQDAVGISP